MPIRTALLIGLALLVLVAINAVAISGIGG
jgi:hypothetical protein